jgi:hypothetical protein
MNILVACEESQAVCIEFRKFGHNAFSNDIKECSGGHPEWHLQMDCFEAISLREWNMMIAFPPCTDLAVSGARCFERKKKEGIQQKSIEFFFKLVNANIPRIAIENPIGIMSTIFRKPDQIVQPYFFGDPYKKSTCLWLKNLPKLYHVSEDNLFDFMTVVEPEFLIYNSSKTKSGTSKYSKFGKLGKGKGAERSKTPIGLAKAMASQWSICEKSN